MRQVGALHGACQGHIVLAQVQCLARRERTRSEQHAAHALQDQREAEDELHATRVAQHAAEEASCAGACTARAAGAPPASAPPSDSRNGLLASLRAASLHGPPAATDTSAAAA